MIENVGCVERLKTSSKGFIEQENGEDLLLLPILMNVKIVL